MARRPPPPPAPLAAYLRELAALAPEALPEPQLREERLAKDAALREERELAAGAVRAAELAAGDAAGGFPGVGDLVLVHFALPAAGDGPPLHDSAAGGGPPLAFVLGKGRRAPRAWELALQGARARALGRPAPPRRPASDCGEWRGRCSRVGVGCAVHPSVSAKKTLQRE